MFELHDPLAELAGIAMALGAEQVAELSNEEHELLRYSAPVDPAKLRDFYGRILSGQDPLGEMFCSILSSVRRRALGATYTPSSIVEPMLKWAGSAGSPSRIIDPGCGSGRFLVAAGRKFPEASLIGVEVDPLAATLARAHLSAAGLSSRSEIRLCDYRDLQLNPISGATLFIGNPPYVRHHNIGTSRKSWFSEAAKSFGQKASQLAGLHIHFLLATAQYSAPGDLIAFVTSAEWLDVNYGRLARHLFLEELGGVGIHLVEPSIEAFPGTQTTAAISTYRVGSRIAEVRIQKVDEIKQLQNLTGTRVVSRKLLQASQKWSILSKGYTEKREGLIELGELCRVHRGQVTGSNSVWISGEHTSLLPSSVLYKSVTRALELFGARDVLDSAESLKSVVDIPTDLDTFDLLDRQKIEAFLDFARSRGADRSYVAMNRRAWWSVGLREPAPILATYMARRSPAFVVNQAKARHINVAHGLYPRISLSVAALHSLASFLSANTDIASGRTYSGGLTKFEPKEMERILIPNPVLLENFERRAA